MYASAYELYDRISAPYQKFLETLSVTCSQAKYVEAAKRLGIELFEGPRGAPENVGTDLAAVHPLVRTNPVTGWKSIFGVGIHIEKINGLSDLESEHLKDAFLRLIMENHDLQARCRWQNPNDIGELNQRSSLNHSKRHSETNKIVLLPLSNLGQPQRLPRCYRRLFRGAEGLRS